MNAAIYYFADGFDTSRAKLMGRHAAGEEFLKGWARFSRSAKFYCYAKNRREFHHFASRIKSAGQSEESCVWIPWNNWPTLQAAGTLFLPGPDLASLAYQREHFDRHAFSVVGITHTTASDRVMDSLGEILVAPTQRWDALICTSKSVKQMVERVIGGYAEHLKARFGLEAPPAVPVQLPVIPLGINCQNFNPEKAIRSRYRTEWRRALQIDDDDFAVLYMGRLSFHAKAHPVAMYKSLEATAARTGKRIHLLMAGWFANDAIRDEFAKAAKTFCPSVRVTFLDGRKPEVRHTVWFGADAFCSLSDNVQETFGLTPLEGMAAGLPVVASDWDGYKETVRDGQDGFLIKTWASPAGTGKDLAGLNAQSAINYDEYIGWQSQFAAVDVKATADAFVALASNESLRARMGEAARQCAQSVFDWRVVVGQYQDLFAELEAIRKCENSSARRPAMRHPLRQDPTYLFEMYPSELLAPTSRIRLIAEDLDSALDVVMSCSMNTFAIDRLQLKVVIGRVIDCLRGGGEISLGQLMTSMKVSNETDGMAVQRAVLWLAKMDLLALN
jgi:glycosyltransferase involved in cell wall biosynthesis